MSHPMMAHDDQGHHVHYDEGAEQSVLGAMMASKDAIADVVEVLRPEDFYLPKHQAICKRILDLYSRDVPTDPVSLADDLLRRGDLGRCGGAPYLHTLFERSALLPAVGHHAGIVADQAGRRRLVEAAARMAQRAHTADDVHAAFASAQADLDEAVATKTSGDTSLLGDLVQQMFDTIEEFQTGARQRGVRTGLADLDAVTNGLHPGQMITVAARPGMGKSVLGMQFARSCAIKQGKACVIFSLEMSRVEIMMRLAAAEAKIRLRDLRSQNGLTDADWNKLARAMGDISEAPLLINDEATATVASIRAKAKQLKKSHDIQLVVVDYLQLMGSGTRTENRQQEVSEFSRQLKLLAKELDVPVVAISQLNRGPEQRQDKRPMLSDLRESGSIEQDSDVVILINRPDAWERDDPRAGEADLIIAKHRDGVTGTVTVAHQLHYSRFTDMARDSGPGLHVVR